MYIHTCIKCSKCCGDLRRRRIRATSVRVNFPAPTLPANIIPAKIACLKLFREFPIDTRSLHVYIYIYIYMSIHIYACVYNIYIYIYIERDISIYAVPYRHEESTPRNSDSA